MKAGAVATVLFICIMSETAQGKVLPNETTTGVVAADERKPEVKINSDTTINGGPRIVSGLEIYPGRGDGESGPQGPAGPAGETGPMGPAGPQGPTTGGANYVRWGRTTCPDTNGTELLYKGVAAGAFFDNQGGGSNYLCLPDEPEFLQVTAGHQDHRSRVYGTEYEALSSPPALGNIRDHNVPCAACYTSERGDKIMIPGKINCPSSWTREYYGYLMSEHVVHRRMSYECVDVDAESIPGSAGNIDGALFYFTEVYCTGISCPPYEAGNELTCVVCTK